MGARVGPDTQTEVTAGTRAPGAVSEGRLRKPCTRHCPHCYKRFRLPERVNPDWLAYQTHLTTCPTAPRNQPK